MQSNFAVVRSKLGHRPIELLAAAVKNILKKGVCSRIAARPLNKKEAAAASNATENLGISPQKRVPQK